MWQEQSVCDRVDRHKYREMKGKRIKKGKSLQELRENTVIARNLKRMLGSNIGEEFKMELTLQVTTLHQKWPVLTGKHWLWETVVICVKLKMCNVS